MQKWPRNPWRIHGEQILDLLIPTNSLSSWGRETSPQKKFPMKGAPTQMEELRMAQRMIFASLEHPKAAKITWKTVGEAPLPNAHLGRIKESPEGWEVLLVSLFIPKIMWDKIPPLLKKKSSGVNVFT